MATHILPPKNTNWWLWGGGGAALLVAIALFAFGFDVFGLGVNDAIAPTITMPD